MLRKKETAISGMRLQLFCAAEEVCINQSIHFDARLIKLHRTKRDVLAVVKRAGFSHPHFRFPLYIKPPL